jgi:hypothetical protein
MTTPKSFTRLDHFHNDEGEAMLEDWYDHEDGVPRYCVWRTWHHEPEGKILLYTDDLAKAQATF